MLKNKESLASAGLLLLRVAFGCLMLVHGWQKLSGFSELADKFPDPIGMGSTLSLVMAIAAEVGCSLLLIAGFGTRFAAIPLAFTMIVALFVVHGGHPWEKRELAACYLAVYATLMLTGAGRFSVDHCLWGKKDETVADSSMLPYPHYEPVPGNVELVVQVQEDGTRSVGREELEGEPPEGSGTDDETSSSGSRPDWRPQD